MTSHTVSLIVWGLIGSGCVLLWALSRSSRAPSAQVGQLVDTVMLRPAARVAVVLGWMWLGWHTFAR